MNIFRTSTEILKHQDFPATAKDPRFRRATINMIGSTLVCEKILRDSSIEISPKLGFIYGSHFGEMTSSTQYLSALENEKIGKPILFQNSLHNSTLGFISIELKIIGPSLTVSGGKYMNQALIDAAEALLFTCDQVLICTSESIPEKYQQIYSETFPNVSTLLTQSQAFLLSKQRLPHAEAIKMADLKII